MRPQYFCDQDQAILKDIKKTSARTQINSVLNYFLVKKGDILRKKAIWEKRKLLGKTLKLEQNNNNEVKKEIWKAKT